MATVDTHAADPITCPEDTEYLPAKSKTDGLPDLKVTGACLVRPGYDYFYGQVNIVEDGQLNFREYDEDTKSQYDTVTNFWASSIIIERDGKMDIHSFVSRSEASLVSDGAQNSQRENRARFKGRTNSPEQQVQARLLSSESRERPYGLRGGKLNIYLYGKDEAVWDASNQVFTNQNEGALCATVMDDETGPCGIPINRWTDNGQREFNLPGLNDPADGRTDYFYQYGPLYADAKCKNGEIFGVVDGSAKCGNESADGNVGYFGKKVIAVSYGGSLEISGYKGACTDREISEDVPGCDGLRQNDELRSAPGWTRLAANLEKNAGELTLESTFKGAEPGDEIIVTTTDYLPGHSELLKIESGQDGKQIALQPLTDPCSDASTEAPCYFHQGERFPLEERLEKAEGRLTINDDLVRDGAEIRAGVAHMTRSVRIISAGDAAGDYFPEPDVIGDSGKPYSFGGQLIARQGFEKFQVQGVEFVSMGQGGRMGHYPIHFHKARETPKGTFVKDSSINVSMTRWIVLHSTNGVELERNIGYKSIGHGFYLEDGTETNNSLYSNLGILARAAVKDSLNPREIPGILAYNDLKINGSEPAKDKVIDRFPYFTDNFYPSVFWITNGWNDFQGNMAAGAGACGAAYWLVPTANSDRLDIPNDAGSQGNRHMKWSGYSQLQMSKIENAGPNDDRSWAGTTPVKTFFGNSATSAMHSFQTTSDAPACDGFISANESEPNKPAIRSVTSISRQPVYHTDPNGFPQIDNFEDPYYPHVEGGYRHATVCESKDDGKTYNCSTVPACAATVTDDRDNTNNVAFEQCTATVIDHFTSSFHWANGNISAVWLRPQWYLLDNSVITDVQNGGLSFVSGGDPSHTSAINGYWAVARNTIFIGQSQPDNPYAYDKGPFNDDSGLKCEDLVSTEIPAYCVSSDEGISMPVTDFFTYQHFNNIYDGPNYQDSNVYLDITPTECPISISDGNWDSGYNGDCMYASGTAKGIVNSKPNATSLEGYQCWLANTAIGWKQPNGFYYPPAFHSRNLFFDNVTLRHYVIEPLFLPPDGVLPDQNFGQEGTYRTDIAASSKVYCGVKPGLQYFTGFTDVDRQTELNDDDGTLTGLINDFRNRRDSDHDINQTISVNEDLFFGAPLETPECAAGIGPNVNPANACSPNSFEPRPTAKTSPYDYVSTVIYWDPLNPNNVDTHNWMVSCSNPDCPGVRLFRQYMTGTKGADANSSTRDWKHWFENGCNVDKEEPQCRWPYIRMAGESLANGITLTANNGKYFLDTTYSKNQQIADGFPNNNVSHRVFVGGNTYLMFFVFAKDTTSQTYQVYVGEGFDTDTDLEAVWVNIDAKYKIQEIDNGARYKPAPRDWMTAELDSNNVLTVELDFSRVKAYEKDYNSNGLCQPHNFCKPNATSNATGCESNLSDGDPLIKANPQMKAEADAVCREWAAKDFDCPDEGCLGFTFKLPSTFSADGSYHRPDPEPFPTDDDSNDGKPFWTAEFKRTKLAPDSKAGGQCYYAEIPGTDCNVP